MERRFTHNQQLNDEYVKFMQDYIDEGHMETATENSQIAYYLPHHSVHKLDSTTTKLRVVFDASCESSNGL